MCGSAVLPSHWGRVGGRGPRVGSQRSSRSGLAPLLERRCASSFPGLCVLSDPAVTPAVETCDGPSPGHSLASPLGFKPPDPSLFLRLHLVFTVAGGGFSCPSLTSRRLLCPLGPPHTAAVPLPRPCVMASTLCKPVALRRRAPSAVPGHLDWCLWSQILWILTLSHAWTSALG